MPKLELEPTSRTAINSEEYVKNSSLDLFENLQADVATICEESREDCVKIDLGAERYEIYPATKARVIVKHYHEDLPEGVNAHALFETSAYPDATATRVVDPVPQLELPSQPTDRDIIAQAKALSRIERTTSDPEFWAAVEWARKAREHVTFLLPRGIELPLDKRRALESLFECLVAEDMPGALQGLANYMDESTRESRRARFKKRIQKLFGRVEVHDRV